jgi:hypothetical protein
MDFAAKNPHALYLLHCFKGKGGFLQGSSSEGSEITTILSWTGNEQATMLVIFIFFPSMYTTHGGP